MGIVSQFVEASDTLDNMKAKLQDEKGPETRVSIQEGKFQMINPCTTRSSACGDDLQSYKLPHIAPFMGQ